MKLTVRGEYALRALTYLGAHFSDGVIQTATIATSENIPKRFLEQILNDLKSGRFVESRRGVAGGYRLAKPPGQIELAAVVRHVDGALAPIGCVSERFYEKCNCPDEARCPLRSVMKEIRDSIAAQMEKLSIADLVTRGAFLRSLPAAPSDFVI